MFSHLCSVNLLPLTSPQVRSPGDLIWRWAPYCEHGPERPGRAQLHGPTFASHLILKSWLPTWLSPPCPRTASYSIFRLRWARKALIATRGRTELLPSLVGRASHHFGGAISGAVEHPHLLSTQSYHSPLPQLAYNGV